jgi:hypothetical protein
MAKNTSTTAVAPTAASRIAARDPVSARRRYAARHDEQEDHQRARAADRRDRREVDEVGDDQHHGGRDQESRVLAEPRLAPEERRELPGRREHRRQPARRVQGRVHRGRRGQQGRDGHHGEPGVSERRPGGLGDRGLAVADHLVDGQRPEDAERDQDVRRRRDAQGEVHGPRKLPGRVAQIAGGEGDDAEAEVGEERQRDARDDVREGRIAAEGEQAEVDVGHGHADEDDEDGEQDDDDQRLRPVDHPRADEVDRRHRDHDRRREDVVPAAGRVVSDEERGRVAAERDRDHRADDHEADEELPEPLDRRDAHALVRRVRRLDLRPERDHVEAGDLVADHGRLQPGVNRGDDRSLAEEPLVDGLRRGQCGRVEVGRHPP